ncbi:MAG TPA: cytochrome C oxidase subunit IV family protein [Pyrinomonadaceae bacterium]|nr:cytochrome C oxidase subunit IV family protein [Pyrinomonadaceae bacterium]
MSAHMEEHFAGTNKLFISIWGWLLGLTLIEIVLAYRPMPIHFMLTILMGLSIIKAALIVAYFMHLKFERLSLVLTIVPVLVVCICLLFLFFFPDSFRSSDLRYQFKETPPATVEESH